MCPPSLQHSCCTPGTSEAPLTSCRLRSSGWIFCRIPASSTCGRALDQRAPSPWTNGPCTPSSAVWSSAWPHNAPASPAAAGRCSSAGGDKSPQGPAPSRGTQQQHLPSPGLWVNLCKHNSSSILARPGRILRVPARAGQPQVIPLQRLALQSYPFTVCSESF